MHKTTTPHVLTGDTLPLAALQKPQGHKYDHGHALVLSGGSGRTGAARLAARGALRIGAGAVTLGAPPASYLEIAVQITSVMLRRVDDSATLISLLEDKRINAICLGPGFGLGDRERTLLSAVLEVERPCVLDADALTLLSRDNAAVSKLHGACILTPHAGEFARLFPDLAEEMIREPGFTKQAATAAAAAQSGAIIIFKGPKTWISTPEGQIACHRAMGHTASPWLATAGAGDVLAGFVTGLMARGFRGFDACLSMAVQISPVRAK